MAIKGAIFDNQVPTAKNWGSIFKPMYTDGILQGCAVTCSGSNAFIAPGALIGCGRVFVLDAQASFSFPAPGGGGEGYGRIVATIDLSGTATTSAFNQVTLTTESATTVDGFAALTQNNVNLDGTRYQFEVARFKLSGTSVTEVVSTCGKAGLDAELCHFFPETYYGTQLPATGEEGQLFFLIID